MTRDDVAYGAATVWGEARGESFEGKVAVAKVLFNRVADQRWPKTLKEVATQRMQFSCWNDNDPNKAKVVGVVNRIKEYRDLDEVILDCLAALATAYASGPDMTEGANHYHTDSIQAYWSKGKTPSAKIGRHLFFKL